MHAKTRVFGRSRALRSAAGAVLVLLLSSAILGTNCDGHMTNAFRQTATRDIGQGLKEFLGGNPDQAVETIMFAAVDGLVAGIEQAGSSSSR
jgi:hypothetical protein